MVHLNIVLVIYISFDILKIFYFFEHLYIIIYIFNLII